MTQPNDHGAGIASAEFLALHVAQFEIPHHSVSATQVLPRTPSGKILKREIKQATLTAIAAVHSGSTRPA